MNGKDCKLLLTVFQTYSSLEKEIQKRTNQISSHFCNRCPSKCCKEEICRESVESTFLSILVEKQNIEYDRQNGWISPSGCRLNYGRPLVCYEFFCEDIVRSKNFQSSNIQRIIKEFISIGKRAYGNTHLICIDNLKTISQIKIAKINYKLKELMNKLAVHSMQMEGANSFLSCPHLSPEISHHIL